MDPNGQSSLSFVGSLKSGFRTFGDALGELALQVGQRGIRLDHDKEHESIRSLAATLAGPAMAALS